jgi:CspA family cold shock protein
VPEDEFVSATVKFYDEEKGYGFVTTDSFEGDIYLSRGLVDRAGQIDLSPGAVVSVVIKLNPGRGAEANALKI